MCTDYMVNTALRYMGIPQGKAEEQMIRKVKEKFNSLQQIALPKVTYRKVQLKLEADEVHICGTHCHVTSKDLSKLFKNSAECILMAATLGIEVDREIIRWQKRNMLEAMILDACASVVIDIQCDEAEQEIIGSLEENQYLTMRFSPGYGDVPLEMSGEILEVLMAGKRIGLTLTQSHMLLPTKSITALIGISNQKENREKSCGHCNLVKTCTYRRRGDRCGL